MSGTVIIGGGIAGQAVAERLREAGYDKPVAMLCAESRPPYDRVKLASLLEPGGDPEALQLRPDTWYEDHAVDLHLGVEVTDIDRAARAVVTAAGERITYDTLVVATGSTALVPPIPGIDRDDVLVFRTPEDCEAMVAAAAGTTRACVLGGGLLGLEAARGLVALGVQTTVVHLMGHLMERQLDPFGGSLLTGKMQELSVEVLVDRNTHEVLSADGRVSGLLFTDGSTLDCDLLVVCAGIRPNTALARAAGLECERGVLVDDNLRTSDPHVFSVGECAQHRGVVYGLVAPIFEQAKVAARTIAGDDAAGYEGTVPSAALKVMGVDLVTAGDPMADGGVSVADPETGVYRRLIVSEGRAVGAILMGDTRGAESLVAMVTRGAEVDDPLAALAAAAEAKASDLPDDAQVCACNGVSKGDILTAIREKGLRAPSEVRACTRAGTGCGQCKPLIAEIVAAEVGEATDEATYLCPCRNLTREQVAAVIKERGLRSAGEVAEACGAGRDCGACKPGVAYLVSLIAANRHREEPHSRFINDRVHANIQKDGTFSVVPRIYGGVTTPDELRRIADVAERYEVPMVKITGGQRIDLLGVKKEHLPAMWQELGMPCGHAYAKAIRTVKTCVGAEFCRFGIDNSIDLGIALEKAWEGLYTPHKVKGAVSGCPRNCAEALVKDIGVVAVEGGWEILVGGAAGSTVRRGDLLARVDTAEDVVKVSSTFLQYYREHAEYLERTYDFVERVGLDTIKAAVLDESTGEPAALRERLALARAAARDPWEAAAAGARTEFHDLGEDPEPALVGPPADGSMTSFEDDDKEIA
ncbi:MAG: nitrite reductase large subunit NirB [Actinomycetota bacterium]